MDNLKEPVNTSVPQGLMAAANSQAAQQEIPFASLPLEEKINRLYQGMVAQEQELQRLKSIADKTVGAVERHTHDDNGCCVIATSVFAEVYRG